VIWGSGMDAVKNLLIFDIKGPMAHFRAFYTNSSSLSYAFPPRTVIIGLIAGILGRPKDSYYKDLSSQNCCIALSIRSPIRKIMQTVNYVNTQKSKGGKKAVNASAGHTQVPLEIIVPKTDSQIVYRIYFSHTNQDVMSELKMRVENKAFVFPPYLGLSEFIANVKFINFLTEKKIAKISKLGPVETLTVLNAEKIPPNGLNLNSQSSSPLQYMKERMPVEFDEDRKLKKVANFIYERNLNKINVFLRDSFYLIEYNDGGKAKSENIVFME